VCKQLLMHEKNQSPGPNKLEQFSLEQHCCFLNSK
jgi:hypothetical protein